MADHEATQERSLKVEDQLTHLLTARYGYTPAQLTSLGGEHDWNYRCIDTNGDVSFVRLTPAWVGDETVEWQNRVLLRLEEAPLSVHSPRLLAQADGAIMSQHSFPGDEIMTLRVTTWCPGAESRPSGKFLPVLGIRSGRWQPRLCNGWSHSGRLIVAAMNTTGW